MHTRVPISSILWFCQGVRRVGVGGGGRQRGESFGPLCFTACGLKIKKTICNQVPPFTKLTANFQQLIPLPFLYSWVRNSAFCQPQQNTHTSPTFTTEIPADSLQSKVITSTAGSKVVGCRNLHNVAKMFRFFCSENHTSRNCIFCPLRYKTKCFSFLQQTSTLSQRKDRAPSPIT